MFGHFTGPTGISNKQTQVQVQVGEEPATNVAVLFLKIKRHAQTTDHCVVLPAICSQTHIGFLPKFDCVNEVGLLA